MMDIANFEDLMRAAQTQREPQRLLFVFAGAELPEDSTPDERARFAAGAGGALIPLMCADKTPSEAATFEALAGEAQQFGHDWAMVFVAALAGRDGRAPTSEDAGPILERMVGEIKAGRIGAYVPFDRHGVAVMFD